MKKMLIEYLRKNSDIRSFKNEVLISELRKDQVLSDLGWNYKFSLNKSYSAPDVSNTVFKGQTDSESFNLSIIKNDSFGGTFTIGNSFERKRQDGNAFTDSNTKYDSSLFVNYNFDLLENFLGRNTRKSIALSKAQVDLTESKRDDEIESGSLNFIMTFLNVKYLKEIYRLSGESKIRAQKRLQLIAKYVRDGIKDPVDLVQAKINLTRQKSNEVKAKIDLDEALKKISFLMHREVSLDEFSPFMSIEKSYDLTLKNNNKKINVLEKEKKIVLFEEEINKNKSNPSIDLTLNYKLNAIDQNYGQSMSDLYSFESGEEWSVALNFKSTFGENRENIEKRISYIKKTLIEYKLRELKKSNINNINFLRKNVYSSYQKILYNKERSGLAKEALGRINRLYKLGRRNLDELIGAEEELISTEISVVNDKLNYLLNFYKFKKENGSLLERI